jgi:uncharacterized protein YkwD
MKNKRGFVWLFAVMLAGAYVFGGRLAGAAETNEFAARLVERGIYEADAKGSLNLDQNLTRAELAMILTRMDFASPPGSMEDWRVWGKARFSDPARRYHPYTDVTDADWVRPYAEYCYELGYMRGVSAELFDPQGLISPQTACTALLRYCCVPKNEYGFDTSVDKARSLGLIPSTGMDGETVTYGGIAEAIVRSLTYYAEKYPAPGLDPSPTPTLAPTPTSTPEPTSVPALKETYTQEELEAMALEAVRLTNAEREKAGLSALTVMPELMASSQAKAQDMKENHYYGHVSPVYGDLSQMLKTFGIRCAAFGENVSVMDISAADVVAGWMASEGHRENILTKAYTHIGIGLVRGTQGFAWVQHFIQSK